jgi:hypothetical protein
MVIFYSKNQHTAIFTGSRLPPRHLSLVIPQSVGILLDRCLAEFIAACVILINTDRISHSDIFANLG